jgi:hypothetical protein
MTIHLPLEIHAQIFSYLLNDLYDSEHPEEAFNLRLISKSIRGILDPVLYRNLNSPSYNGVHILCRTIIPQPLLAARVEEVDLEEDDWSSDGEEEDEEEENTDADSDSGSDSSEYSYSKVQQARRREESKLLAGAADSLKGKFTSDPSYSRALEKNDLS